MIKEISRDHAAPGAGAGPSPRTALAVTTHRLNQSHCRFARGGERGGGDARATLEKPGRW